MQSVNDYVNLYNTYNGNVDNLTHSQVFMLSVLNGIQDTLVTMANTAVLHPVIRDTTVTLIRDVGNINTIQQHLVNNVKVIICYTDIYQYRIDSIGANALSLECAYSNIYTASNCLSSSIPFVDKLRYADISYQRRLDNFNSAIHIGMENVRSNMHDISLSKLKDLHETKRIRSVTID